MEIIYSISDMKKYRENLNGTVGFVPTMGYLHEGHLSLVAKSKKDNDITIVSIFVNPIQFGIGEDLDKYPRDADRDAKMLREMGVDVLFIPSNEEMYPAGYLTYCETLKVTEKLCGVSRPTHFRGVTTVVLKLFNITTPHNAYFGEKDAQQLFVIRKMTLDLNLSINIIGMPIIREADGLAKSSRNVYLSEEDRKNATILYKSLMLAKDMIKNGETQCEIIKNAISGTISSVKNARIDYVEMLDSLSFEDITSISPKTLIAIAVRFGQTRLIDNITVSLDDC